MSLHRKLLWVKKNLLPGIIVSVVVLFAIFLVGELYLRIAKPFSENKWPGQFNEKVGFTFTPLETVRLTNNFDFWTEQKANSIGFLDNEPKPLSESKNAFRIVILGDSFVEAAQVAIEKKFFRILQDKIQQQIKKPVEIIGMGYSGAGTVDALAFYREYAKEFKPDLVILLFVSNDFANNSSLLESIRNGWHPEHLPRPHLFIKNGQIKEMVGDKDWQKYTLPVKTSESNTLMNLMRKSMLFKYVSRQWRGFSWNKALNTEPKCEPLSDFYVNNIIELQKEEKYAKKLQGWKIPNDLVMDQMFYTADKPEAFNEALVFTDYLLAKLDQEVRNNNGQLLVAGAENMHRPIGDSHNQLCGRSIDNQLLVKSLTKITKKHAIHFYDLNPDFKAYPDQSKLLFRFDGHWSAIGHQVAAESLYNYLIHQPEMLRN